MSLVKGNKYFKKGLFDKAIAEYKRVPKDHPSYKHAEFNIRQALKKGNDNIHASNTKLHHSDVYTKMPKLSIVMPVFNVASYLEASILSVLNQKYRNVELIIIDDASSDESLKIIKMFEKIDFRVKVISLKYNTLGGAGIPSNIGISHASGDYLAFVDSDDFIDGNAYSELIELAQKSGADVVVGGFKTFTDDVREISDAYDLEWFNKLPKEQLLDASEYLSMFKLSPVPWRKLYKRDFLQNHNIKFPHADCFYEDNPLHWFVLASSKKVILSEQLVSYHRMARPGQTMGASSYKLSAMFAHMHFIFNVIKGNSRIVVAFLRFIRQSIWIVNRQSDVALQALFKKKFAQLFDLVAPYAKDRRDKDLPMIRKIFEQYNNVYRDVELTIIVVIENFNKTTVEFVKSMAESIDDRWSCYVICQSSVDSGVVKKHLPINVHVFDSGKNNKWRSINMVLPLCIGKYTVFVDPAYGFSIENIKLAIQTLKENKKCRYYKHIDSQGETAVFDSLFETRFIHEKGVFFGASGNIGWSSFIHIIDLYSNLAIRDNHSLVSADGLENSSELIRIDDLIAEINNLVSYFSFNFHGDSEKVIKAVSSLITSHEYLISLDDYGEFRNQEVEIMNSLLSEAN